ncbi:helix-turn-helix transcriptional regulator [Enterococcus dispar]|uniref:helix-turn-helix transcriptional regulator n=1 Tax=Enterococcus dispar TaxID=44009 RepID=UPI002491D456|nr:helix-turn-helix domain-containing protein [Enterococcus dispar]
MNNKIAGYRRMLGLTQKEMAKKFGISKQAYYLKEKGTTAFSDSEKILFKMMLRPLFPQITIDEIFFAPDVLESTERLLGKEVE